MLTLKIENFDRLPDGGPVQFRVDRRGFDLGRDQHLDWTLPDPSRAISGKHCEIRYFDGCYWLYDVSTNGTFVNNSGKRMQSPYKLADGDQLTIGEYIISVSVKGLETARTPPQSRAGQAMPPRPAADAWPTGNTPPPPIDPRDLMPPREKGARAGDFLSSIPAILPVNEPARPAIPQPPRPSRQHDPWAPTGVGHPAAEPAAASGVWPAGNELPFPAPHKEIPAAMPAGGVPSPVPGPLPLAGQDQGGRDFLLQFALGANIPVDALIRRDAGALGKELGVLLNMVCANLMQLLQARAAAKTLARSGHRTLIQPVDNNPIKFMPTAEDAIKIMLGPPSPGYLDSRQTIEKSFADIKSHQLATLAAMQQAIAKLIEDLAPEAIEQSGANLKPSLLGGNKAKLWDTFCERWKTKAGRHEHGMLGEFLDLFAEFYDQQTRGK
ncbi:MAG: type VI secretion system-associated FHA domain protein TagH [Hyphomicrobiales bacterium]